MKVELISVGTELLLGDIVNTNAQYLSRELANIGISVYHQSTVGDNFDRLIQCFDEALSRSDIVITTGGLGPTKDDITKEAACRYFGFTEELNDEVWEKIEERLKKYRKNNVVSENNKKQAMFPKEAQIIDNEYGTAPGAIYEKDGKKIIVMPGPPREMMPMFDNKVKPFLSKDSEDVFVSRYIRFYGIGESNLETQLEDILDKQTNPTIALYAKSGEVLIRVTASGKDKQTCLEMIELEIGKLKNRVGKYIYLIGDDSISSSQSELEKVTAALLVEKNIKIATAESCTGGKVASMLIDYPGISDVFLEGLVTYSNEAKMRTLGVKKETLEKYGAVSYETAIEMARGAAIYTGADIAVSTTGVAGPGGGTKDKPVGLVYIGVYFRGVEKAYEMTYSGTRNQIRDRTARDAINFVRELVK